MYSLLVNSDEESEEGAFVVANPIDTTSSSNLPFNAFGLMHDVMLIVRTIKGLSDF